jgi:hypothetical protein
MPIANESQSPDIIEAQDDEREVFEKICCGDLNGVEFNPKHSNYVGANPRLDWNVAKAKQINSMWYGWLKSIANRKDKAKIEQLQTLVAELTHQNAVLQEKVPGHTFPENAQQANRAKALLRDPRIEPAIAGHGAFWQERGQECSQLTGGHPGELKFGISYVRSLGFECKEHALIRLDDHRVDMTALRAHISMLSGVLLDVYNQNELSLAHDQAILAALELNDPVATIKEVSQKVIPCSQ